MDAVQCVLSNSTAHGLTTTTIHENLTLSTSLSPGQPLRQTVIMHLSDLVQFTFSLFCYFLLGLFSFPSPFMPFLFNARPLDFFTQA